MKTIVVILVVILFNACIPLRVAPDIKDYKLVKAKNFKRKLPKQKAFIFNDPKDADEFYQFIDAKFDLDNQLLDKYQTFNLNNKQYVFSFSEVERIRKTLNT